MKLLLIAAAMVGSAYGACIAATSTEVTAANVVCNTACMNILTAAEATAAATCAIGFSGAATATVCGTEGGKLTWGGCTACTAQAGCTTAGTGTACATGTATTKYQCTAVDDGYWLSGTTTAKIATECTKAANVATLTCDDATVANTRVLTCAAGFAKTDIVGATVVSDPVAGRAFIAADAAACPAVVGQSEVVASVDAAKIPASCATTACSGEQTGCVTGADTNTVDTCSTGGKLRCTATTTGFKISASGAVTACAIANAATYVAAATPWNTCVAATCDASWILANGACIVAKSCTAGAVPAMYAATGIATTTVAAVTRVCTSETTCAATPPTGTCTAGVTEVTGVAAKLASAATTVALLGTVTCATGFTGTAVAACPTADGAFTYTGCAAAAAAPASVAQTIVAFVLTVVAMYL